MDKPIVLTEYPKSGGSWITSLLGEALGISKRDIYMRPGFDLFDTTEHPWYNGGAALDIPQICVIKSHELPRSPLFDFDVDFLHLVRDGRDVIVSKWFFDTDFMIKNEISDSFTKSFDEYVEETATAWSDYVKAWADTKASTIRYEDFLVDPHAALGATIKTMTGVDMPRSVLEYAVSAHTKDKFAQSLSRTFKHNTFVRKGIAGDWKNHFSDRNIERFNQIAAEAMSLLGYTL